MIKKYLIISMCLLLFSVSANATLLWESDKGQLALQNPPSIQDPASMQTSSINYNIGFNVNYYGNSFSDIWLNSNGTATFNDKNIVTWNGNFPTEQTLDGNNNPQPNESMKMLAPLWDSLLSWNDLDNDGIVDPDVGIWVNTIGSPGSRKLVITWNNLAHWNESGDPGMFYGSDTFQATFTEGSNDILFSYLNLNGVTDPLHSSGYSFGNYYFPNDYFGITIGVNAGDYPGSTYIRGSEYLYGFVDNSLLPENDSILLTYDENYYAPGVGEYFFSTYNGGGNPVPEPSTLFLTGTALLAALFIRRKKFH